MFDLFRSQAKAVRYLLGAILMLVALSMVVTLVPGFGGAGYSGNDNVIAEIGDETLTTQDVQVQIQQQLRNNAFPREMARAYVPMTINQMITDWAVAYEARRLGFEVTDADVARAVQSMIPQLFQNGQFVGQQVYAQYLSQMNMTIPQFEANVRKQILLLNVLNLALEGEIVTDEEIEREFRKANEKIKIDYIAVSPADYRSQVKITPDEIKQYYETNKTTFQVGEQRDAKIIVADETEVGKTVRISDEELKKIYRGETDRFRTPERVKVRHILLKTMGKSKEEIVQIKAKTEDLLKQLKNGADFAELAKANSDDTGTAINGGDLGWIARGQTVANFEKTAFSLEPGKLSDVIATEYGFHILEVQEKEKARLQPFEEVKDQIAAEQKRQFVFDRMQELAEEARKELTQDPLNADAIAQKLGLSVLSVSKVGAADPIPEVAGSADMQDAIRTMDKAGVSQVYDLGGNRLGVAVVTEIYPVRPAELGEVEDQIRVRLVNQKAQEVVQQKRKQLEELMNSGANNLRELAAELGLTIKTSDEFSRNGNVTGLGAAAYMSTAFEKEVGELVGPINAMGQTVVCKVKEKIPADMTQLASQRSDIRLRLQQAKARERQELLADGILTQLINEGKVKINEKAIDRVVALYKS